MKFKWLRYVPCVLLLGCAKLPPGGSAAGFTQLTFQFNFSEPIDPRYIYVVAIRVLTPPVGTATSLSDPTQGPSPVVTTGSKNGIVGGLPTHYVIFNSTDPNLYQVYRFPTRAEEGSSADPTDPAAMDLRWPGEYVGEALPGGINPISPDPTLPNGTRMGFTIDTRLLAADQSIYTASSIQTIQFNILTMNVAALTSGDVNERVMDAIGNQTDLTTGTFSDPIQVSIVYSQNYTDSSCGVYETANDTFGGTLPAVDLVSPWWLTVTTP